ncbi:hypothetical protein L6452_35887 [Arctium lappa]|uniref:Uncharacterized protein n=1 Tax=Arctium lappa TaxID=4217 RepID=A0ACB8Y8B2_ARCLA|nr:hypothetical protein L6452_35887 [Arctium lappa]
MPDALPLELLDGNVKRKWEKVQKQSSLLSKLTRQLSVHDNRAAAASNMSNGSSRAESPRCSGQSSSDDWRSAFDVAANGLSDLGSRFGTNGHNRRNNDGDVGSDLKLILLFDFLQQQSTPEDVELAHLLRQLKAKCQGILKLVNPSNPRVLRMCSTQRRQLAQLGSAGGVYKTIVKYLVCVLQLSSSYMVPKENLSIEALLFTPLHFASSHFAL